MFRLHRSFNQILSVYFGIALFFGAAWYFYILSQSYSPSGALLLFTVTMGGASVLFLLFRQIDSGLEGLAFDPVKAFVILDFALLAVQIIIARSSTSPPRYDLSYVCRGSKNLVLRGPAYIHAGLPKYHEHYFYTYPNNQMILVIIAGIYKIESVLTGEISNVYPLYFNILCINLSLVLLFAAAEKIYDAKRAFWCAFKCLFFLPIFSYVPFFYTETFAMPWLMGAVYLYICFRTRCDKEEACHLSPSAFLTLGFAMLLLVIAYKIKGSAGLLLPVMLCDLAFHNRKTKTKAAVLIYSLYLTAVFAAAAKLCSAALIKGLQISERDIQRYQFPMIHWVMMSASGVGGFHENDFLYTLSQPSQAAKSHADWIRLFQKLRAAPAFLKTMSIKIGRTWGYATFMSTRYMPSDFYSRFRVFIHALYFAVFFNTEWIFIRESTERLKGHSNLFKLALFVLALFLLVWETKSRYLVTFLPLWALI
ncbi:MAG: hypothetical protein ACI39G_05120 [Pseudoramibacter sp.]